MTPVDRQEELTSLHAQMKACRLCLEAGFDILPEAVFSGQLGARIMVIGQAPGITEHRSGRPFNASSGTRLFRWLEEAGFDEPGFRASQYLTSITKCYPGKASGGGDRVPTVREQGLCRPYRESEIDLIDPAMIIPVGRLAISLVYRPSSTLSEVVGTEIQTDGRWIVPLPHPSGASRWHQIPENRRRIKKAIECIRAHSKGL